MNDPTTRMWCRWMRATDAARFRPLCRLNRLPISVSPSAVGDSNPMKTPAQPACAASVSSSSSSAKLIVACAIHSLPRFAAAMARNSVLGARDVLARGADQVVVHDQDPLLGDRLELAHDLGDRPLPVAGAVERRHTAERAVHGTAAGRLDRSEGVVRRQQVVAGRPDGVHRRRGLRRTGASGARARRPPAPAARWPSASPVTTASTCGITSSTHIVAWMPPMTTGTPRRRNASRDLVRARRLRGERRDADEVRDAASPRRAESRCSRRAMVTSHSGGVRPASTIRLSGCHTR